MNKEMRSSALDHPNHTLKGNVPDEVLEISSTGYGLESVTEGSDQKSVSKDNSPSCGGL